MTKLYENHRRCPSCNYWADKEKWSFLEVSATDGMTALVCMEYDPAKDDHSSLGSVDILACPECKTMIWER